ncbi:hypothetical protein Bbelb_121370 [Branchiostoma belcheri]|nr:hypothetical protein Bbelb_121370 [Branchiostoma belcheri]
MLCPYHAQAQFWIVHAYPEPCFIQSLAQARFWIVYAYSESCFIQNQAQARLWIVHAYPEPCFPTPETANPIYHPFPRENFVAQKSCQGKVEKISIDLLKPLCCDDNTLLQSDVAAGSYTVANVRDVIAVPWVVGWRPTNITEVNRRVPNARREMPSGNACGLGE